MKRHLFSQMCAEWRQNIWLVIELTIISVVLWFLFIVLFSLAKMKWTHRGYDLNDVYVATMRYIGKESPLYDGSDTTRTYQSDAQLLLASIKGNQYVELAGFGTNSMPYNYNYYGSRLGFTEGDSTYYYSGNMRYVDPDIIKILKLESPDGHTPEQLAAVIERGDIILSTHDMPNSPAASLFVGKDVSEPYNPAAVYRVGASAAGIWRSDYEPLSWGGVIYMPLARTRYNPGEMVIRIKPGMDAEFLESLTPQARQMGNVYLANLKSIDRMRDAAEIDTTTSIQNSTVCAIFLLTVVFLGFLGTFWFRTRQRSGEIAIRKVNGATGRNILDRLISEGLLLLVMSTVPAVIIDWLIIHFNIPQTGSGEVYAETPEIVYISGVFTFLIMAVFVIAGTWIPAWKAMKVDPAYALKDE